MSTQDVNNVILSSAGVGQNDSENQIIMFDPEGRGVSWTLRIAAQTDSKVSAGYSHVAYWQSTLSAFRDIDAMVYFPFITDGDVFKQLLQHEEMFNPSRWSGCMQNVQKKKAYQMQLLGGGFSLPRNLLKKTVCYILSKLATRARKYLYILVPQWGSLSGVLRSGHLADIVSDTHWTSEGADSLHKPVAEKRGQLRNHIPAGSQSRKTRV